MLPWFARVFVTVLSIVAAAGCAPPPPPSTPEQSEPVAAAPPESERNKEVVRAFYDLAFNRQKPEEAVAQYVGPSYSQHNPTAGDGKEAFIALVKGFTKAFPQ